MSTCHGALFELSKDGNVVGQLCLTTENMIAGLIVGTFVWFLIVLGEPRQS